MGKGIKVDFSQLKKFKKELETELSGEGLEDFIQGTAKKLADEFLVSVIKKTPVDKGTLRNGWVDGYGVESGNLESIVSSYVERLKVVRYGGKYIVVLNNDVYYASHMEYGHKNSNGGFVYGRQFMGDAEDDIKSRVSVILEEHIINKIKEIGF